MWFWNSLYALFSYINAVTVRCISIYIIALSSAMESFSFNLTTIIKPGCIIPRIGIGLISQFSEESVGIKMACFVPYRNTIRL